MLAIGCEKDEKFPVEPRIVFKSFEQFGDSASLTISFTDGDGDIGVDGGDTLDNHNLFLTYDVLDQGEWSIPELELELHYRIPWITPTGQNKVLQGDIAVALLWPTEPKPAGSPTDTVRFHVKLVDRAFNESNTVTTDQILVQH